LKKQMQDALLPNPMKGKVRIKSIEKIAEKMT